MTFTVLLGDSRPASTNVIILRTEAEEPLTIDINALTVVKKNKVNDFLNLVGMNTSVSIDNFDKNFELSISVPMDVVLDSIVIDYNQLSSSDKRIVDSFVSVLEA